jgi:hypothetical protein
MFSALPLKADIAQCGRHVRFVPIRDSCAAARQDRYSITSSARTNTPKSGRHPMQEACLKRAITGLLPLIVYRFERRTNDGGRL